MNDKNFDKFLDRTKAFKCNGNNLVGGHKASSTTLG
jgi:hypothetical protein